MAVLDQAVAFADAASTARPIIGFAGGVADDSTSAYVGVRRVGFYSAAGGLISIVLASAARYCQAVDAAVG